MSEPDALRHLRGLNPMKAPIWEQAEALAAYEELCGDLSADEMAHRVGEGYTPSVVRRIRLFRSLQRNLRQHFRRLGLGPHLVDEVVRLQARGVPTETIESTIADVAPGHGAGAEIKRRLWATVDGGASTELVRRLTCELRDRERPQDARVDGDRVVLGPAAVEALLGWLDTRGAQLVDLQDEAEGVLATLTEDDPDGAGAWEMEWVVKGLKDALDEARNLTSGADR